jgi:hypothetical protein
VNVTAMHLAGSAPAAILAAMRATSTEVLPLPLPARRRSLGAGLWTAAVWEGERIMDAVSVWVY